MVLGGCLDIYESFDNAVEVAGKVYGVIMGRSSQLTSTTF
jgi:hypothetical protein